MKEDKEKSYGDDDAGISFVDPVMEGQDISRVQ